MGKADKEFEEHVAKIHEEHEKGLQEGIEIGVERGMKEGERNAKVEAALNALKLGLSVDVVAKISGLTEDKVLNLKKRYKPDYGACLSLVCLYRYTCV